MGHPRSTSPVGAEAVVGDAEHMVGEGIATSHPDGGDLTV
jgi:hypothetical protein